MGFNNERQSRAEKKSITQLGTDTSSEAITVNDMDYAIVAVSLITGTGDCVFKFQVAYEFGGTKYDLEVGGTVAVTETATGDYAYDLELGAAVELYITTTAIGTYDLDANIFAYNKDA